MTHPDDSGLDNIPHLERLPENTEDSFNPEHQRITNTIESLDSNETPKGQVPSTDAVLVQGLPNEEYEFIRLLSRGGLGEVWEARQLSLGRSVALKRIKRETYQKVSQNAPVISLLSKGIQAEAITTAILDHPNIVPVHDFAQDPEGRPLISMKLVRGEPWDIMMKRDWDRMSPTEFLTKHIPILIGMSQAVAFAHSRGIMHRDLKPAQVMVGEFDEVLLTDWGLAVTYDEDRILNYGGPNYVGLIPTIKTASNPAGTLAYMAPEQTELEPNHLGPWTDVYLLGACLYQVLTGKVPHPGGRLEAFKHAQAGKVFPPEIAAPDRPLPAELLSLMNRCMETDFQRRTLSTTEFVNRLKVWHGRISQRMEGITLREQVTRSVRRLDDESDYREFTEHLVLLRRLHYLLPDDAQVIELESDLAARFAVVAARRGDIGLAKLQASLIPDERRRDVVTMEVRRKDEKQRVQQRQRRVFLWGFITLVVIALMSTAYFTSVVTTQQREQLKLAAERALFNQQELYRKRELDALKSLANLAASQSPLESFLAESAVYIRNGLSQPQSAVVETLPTNQVPPEYQTASGLWLRELATSPSKTLALRPIPDNHGLKARLETSAQELEFLEAASDILATGISSRQKRSRNPE
jgi:serine/threonine protein kinase